MSNEAYPAALAMLARRELSEAQLRQRLAHRGYDAATIDPAIARLKADRSLDDARVAGAIARTEAGRSRGRLRVERRIVAAGIAPALARRAADEVFQEVDGDALLAAALDRRLRGQTVADDRERQRLYRYLVAQGFEPDRVLALLRKRPHA